MTTLHNGQGPGEVAPVEQAPVQTRPANAVISHDQLPNATAVAHARLPEVYLSAQLALANCAKMDECQDWANKAEALASYARQSNDDSLQKHAIRIQARAISRCGILLKQIEASTGGRPALTHTAPDTSLTRTQAATDAGLSKRQKDTALRLASVPEDEFERLVESDNPPTVAQLAELGTKHKLIVDIGNWPEVVVPMKVHVGRNTGVNEWYTPTKLIELAREAMGGIDCDPATSELANETVKATKIFTVDDDGRAQEWTGRVWMNPPYAQPLMGDFAEAVSAKYESGEITQACILVNNATETQWFQRMCGAASAVCFPKSRIKFLDPQGNPGAPLQGQAIVYMGDSVEAFNDAFKSEGRVFVPCSEIFQRLDRNPIKIPPILDGFMDDILDAVLVRIQRHPDYVELPDDWDDSEGGAA
jgi:ParB family chromosome partitioning protein